MLTPRRSKTKMLAYFFALLLGSTMAAQENCYTREMWSDEKKIVRLFFCF